MWEGPETNSAVKSMWHRYKQKILVLSYKAKKSKGSEI